MFKGFFFKVPLIVICFGYSLITFAQQAIIEDGIEYILFEDNTATVSRVHYYSWLENGNIVIPSQISDSYGDSYIVTTFGNDSIVFDYNWHRINHDDLTTQDEWYQDDWILEMYPSLLDSIALPETLTKIGKLAFAGCNSLTSIYIPENVSFVDSCAFIGCSNLKEVYTPNLRKWKEINFVGTGWDCTANPLFYAHQLFENGEKVKNIHIQNVLLNDIGDYAFHGWDGTTVWINVGIEKIGKGAFSSCQNLDSISIQSHFADSIGMLCFNNCPNLKYIDLPTSLTKIGSHAFQECRSLTKLVLPSSITTIERGAFNNCYALESIQLPTKLMVIKEITFGSCRSLNNVSIPSLVTKIGEESFYGCNSLTEMRVPDNLLTIERAAFNNCRNLRLITFMDSDTDLIYADSVRRSPYCDLTLFGESPIEQMYIGRNISESFRNSFCSLPTLKILHFGESATEILSEMFSNCEALEDILLSSSIKSIGSKAFVNANNLRKITVDAITPPTVSDDTFSPEIYATTELSVPDASLNLYKEAPVWQKFYNITTNQTTRLTNETNVSCPSIEVLNGSVVVNDAIHVRVYNIMGDEIYSGSAGIIALPAGMYVVVADNKTKKIRL